MSNFPRSNIIIRKWIIWLSFVIAIILEHIPWPEQLIYYRPTWLLLILIYWVMAIPHLVSIGTGFFLGIWIDLIKGLTLGVHALAYSIICYLVSDKHLLIRNMAVWQQSFVITGLSVIINVIVLLIELVFSIVSFNHQIFLNCFSNAILWPWIFLSLRRVRRKFLVG